MKKIVVTGGSGYVGGRVCSHLLESGFQVLMIGRRSKDDSGIPASVNLTYAKADVCEGDLEPLLASTYAVVHFAAMNEIESVSNPYKASAVNIIGLQRILDSAIRSGVNRFIYFSTAHVYGAPLIGQIDETMTPKPSHPYAITHLAGEGFVYAAKVSDKIEGISVRLSNAFGCPVSPSVNRWSLLCNDLCRQAASGDDIRLISDGSQYRDFVPLTDVARAVVHLLEVDSTKIGDGIFNLGGQKAMSVYSMAEEIALSFSRACGWSPRIILPEGVGRRDGAPLRYRIDKLRGTGFELAMDPREELLEMAKKFSLWFPQKSEEQK